MRAAYLRAQRHILLDMHVPDWDERFLTNFDPDAYVELCARAGANAVMVYGNSHAGLCNWPTRSGRMHPGLAGQDVVAAQVTGLRDRGVAVCAYYSGPIFTAGRTPSTRTGGSFRRAPVASPAPGAGTAWSALA